MLGGTDIYEKGKVVKSYPASDPEGMRWDGVHFLLDIARPEDRVALVLFSGDAHVITAAVDPSGFVAIGQDGKGRTLLKKVVADIQTGEAKIVADNDKTGVDP